MRIMITGSNGFIGNFLSNHYREVGHQVFECNRDKLDLLDTNAVNAFMNGSIYFDLVIHTALVGRENLYDLKQSTNDKIITDNLKMWDNLVRNRHRFKRLIIFGSGNEFDTDMDITMADEKLIFEREPKHTYGFVKNQISKDLYQYENFYNLRLFGAFHYTESPKRFFKKIHTHSRQNYHIYEDRFFDFINIEDIIPMIDIIMNGECKHKDINIVYNEKLKLSEMANMFNAITMSDTKIIIDNPNGNNYTGDFTKFYSYNTLKMGLPLGFLRY
jgi:nucleoside-diphosphate-sugar epimerase